MNTQHVAMLKPLSSIMQKQVFRSLTLSYQKKNWLAHGTSPSKPSIGKAPTRKYNLWKQQSTDQGAPARQSFFGYDNDKDLKVCFPVTQVL